MPKDGTIPRVCETCGTDFLATKAQAERPGYGRFCKLTCKRSERLPLADRFYQHVGSGDGCWEWQGHKTVLGYGLIRRDWESVKNAYAHHVAWWLVSGQWPVKPERILHVCDNPPCTRNDDEGWYEVGGVLLPRRGHLVLGHAVHNTRDMVEKGRADWRGLTDPAYRKRGEAAPWSRLTQAQVDEIRELCAQGALSQRAIGKQFGVSQSLVSAIGLGKRWSS